MEINDRDWTIIARNVAPGTWLFVDGWDNESAIDASDANEIIMMHRKSEHGWQLVARWAGPAWKRFQKRRPY